MGLAAQTAMIIDDDTDLSFLLEKILHTRKISVVSVHSLQEAQNCIADVKPSVIFLDNSFPDGLGINFIKNIKASDKDANIIMMTAESAAWIREKAIEEGAQYFLKKPFSKKAIDNVLDKLNFRKRESN